MNPLQKERCSFLKHFYWKDTEFLQIWQIGSLCLLDGDGEEFDADFEGRGLSLWLDRFMVVE